MFKLKEIQLLNHLMFKENISFIDDGEENAKNYISLIIGSNGTGKSQLLRIIADIFIELNEIKGPKKRVIKFEYEFKAKYYSGKNLIEIEYVDKVFNAKQSGTEIENIDIPLPSSVLVLPYNFNDRFSIGDRVLLEKSNNTYDEDYYKYLGLRSASNNIFISGPSKKAIDSLSNIIDSDKKLKDLIPLFNLLNFTPKITIYHTTGRNFNFLMKKEYLIDTKYSADDFIAEFKSFAEKKKETTARRYNDENFMKTLGDKKRIAKVLEFLREYPSLMHKESKSNRIERPLEMELNNAKSIAKFQKEVHPYETLRDLDVFSFDRMEIEKAKKSISMERISSGEYHLLFSMIALFSNISKNALVLIDEPEISLHPNWQMKYIEMLKKIVLKNTSSHFFISSHSHLIVSDLAPKNSAIIGLNNNSGKNEETKVTKINKETFGWSAEQILLEIFEVPTTRNVYLTDEITKIITLLSKKKLTIKQKENLKKRIAWLKKINLNLKAIDPLKEVVSAITK